MFCVLFNPERPYQMFFSSFLKVIPKSEILRHGVLEQSKEEVIVQV